MASKLTWGLGFAGLGAAALVTACFGSGSEDDEVAPQEVNAQRPSTLAAVVVLEGGCTAVRVGPKHLLVGARCVTNRPNYAIGKPLKFRKANVALGDARPGTADGGGGGASDAPMETSRVDPDAAPDPLPSDASSDARSSDAAAASDAGPIARNDAGAAEAGAVSADVYEETIAKIEIHPSFLAKCGTGACGFGKVGGADVADVALLVLGREPADLAIAPVDLDPVSLNDRVLVLSNGCDPASTTTSPKLRAKETKSVAVESALHEGSPFQDSPQSLGPLGKSYVVTRGPGSDAPDAVDALGVCSDRDLGAPLFRFDGSSVVGINSNVTTNAGSRLPITNHHARVDGLSKHQVGAWLAQAGVKTTSSCTGSDGGCPPAPDAGEQGPGSGNPGSEAGSELPPGTPGEELPPPGENPSNGATPDEDPAPKPKKKNVDSSGCSASPSNTTNGTNANSLGLFALLAGVLASRRRRRT